MAASMASQVSLLVKDALVWAAGPVRERSQTRLSQAPAAMRHAPAIVRSARRPLLPPASHPGWGNNELQNYTGRWANVRVMDGNLVLQAQVGRAAGGHNRTPCPACCLALGRNLLHTGDCLQAALSAPGALHCMCVPGGACALMCSVVQDAWRRDGNI